MDQVASFADVLEAVERLSAEEQADLVAIVVRRANERARWRIKNEANEALADFAAGRCTPTTPDDLMNKTLLSQPM